MVPLDNKLLTLNAPPVIGLVAAFIYPDTLSISVNRAVIVPLSAVISVKSPVSASSVSVNRAVIVPLSAVISVKSPVSASSVSVNRAVIVPLSAVISVKSPFIIFKVFEVTPLKYPLLTFIILVVKLPIVPCVAITFPLIIEVEKLLIVAFVIAIFIILPVFALIVVVDNALIVP